MANKQQIKFEADIAGLKSAIKEGESSIKSLTKELKLNQEQLKGNKDNVDLLSTRVETLKQQYEEQTKIVEETNTCYEKAVELFGENSEEAKKWSDKLVDAKTKQEKIKNALDNTNEQLKKQSSNLITLGDEWIKSGEKIEKIGEKINKVGNKLSIVSAGVAAGLVSCVKASIDYESAFAGVEKTVDATEDQLQELNEGILEMSTRMPAAATEIAGVAESAGQLGIKTESILTFSEAMIGLGEATNLTADEAASQLAKFANIMEMSQDDFDKLGSSIVDLGNNFATTEADIVDMAMRLAGAGKQVGLSEGQVLGLATALSSVGIEAEMGGSAISKAMVKMQNAVELGGNKLNKVLKQTGMSLRDLELLSANNSTDFKELCNSIGMTSTEVKNLITAGTNLEDFAKVSGMTTEQFKKQWGEDAAGALGAFIQGLGNAEDKGESAIALLTDMGLTEVRLRDSLLRAANAGDLFNEAIETGTNAWEENVALTNEVNKRYSTTESQLQMLKNEATKLAIGFGNELVPSLRKLLNDAKPLLNTVADAIKKFSNLDDKTKQNTIKILALTVAIGPLVKTVGSLTSTVGKGITSIGKFSQALGVLKTGTESSNANVNSLAGTIKSIISPTGLLTAGLLAAGAAIVYFAAKESESLKESKEFAKTISETKASMDEFSASVDDAARADIAQIDSVSRLKDELESLVDENGKVKDGYESRVSFILNQLNSALGTEYKLNDNIIDSYKTLQDEISETIEKKKAQILLNAEEEKYTNAIKNQSEAVENLKKAQENLGMTYDEAKTKVENFYKEHNEALKSGNQEKMTELALQADEIEALKNYIQSYDDAKIQVQEYTNEIKEYETDYANFMEGNYEEIGKTITTTTANWCDSSINEIKNSILEQEKSLKYYTKIYEDTGNEIAKENAEQAKKNLEDLATELKNRTSTIEELSFDEITAWAWLASQSVDIYKETLSEMPEDARKKIEDITGIVASDTSVSKSFQGLASNGISAFNSAKFEQAGKDAAEKLANGAKKNTGLFTSVGNSFAQKLSSSLVANSGTFSTSGSHADGLAYVPYNGYVARLHEGERVLTKQENADYTRNNINNRTNNVTVNIYTQSVSDSEISRISRQINREWGARA